MANNNTSGCAGGIIQIFGGIGMLFLTCARMGDDVMRCGSAASKFDDIGRTGSRVYYPLDDAALSTTYTKYADDAFAARTQNAIKESSSTPSSLIPAQEELPTVIAKRPITAKAGDYTYTSLRVANALKDIPKVVGGENKVVETPVEEESKSSTEDKIERMHQRLLQKFCKEYELLNPHFNKKSKIKIVKAINKAGSLNFLSMKDALVQIDENIVEIKKVFPGHVNNYMRAVLENFDIFLIMSNDETFNFATLPLARRDSLFAAFLDLPGLNKTERKKVIKNMLR